MKYIYFQRIRLLKNKIAAELRLNFMVLQIKTEGRDKFPINIPQIYVNFMKDERFPFVR